MNKLSMVTITGLMALSMTALHASEFSYLYKDQRIMAMGGANVAAGGYSTSLFSNPAGIAKVSNEYGLIVELLGIQVGINSDSEGLIGDLTDAVDSGETNQITDVFTDHSGQTLHLDVSNYSSITNNHGDLAWSLGLLSALDVNLTIHANEYDLLEVQARGYGGLTSALSYTLQPFDDNGSLSLGLGMKFIAQQSYEGTLTPADLLDFDTIGENLEDKMQSDGSAFGVDLGAIYQFDTYMSPSIGLSILNIGDLDFDGSYGSQPMTVNIGASIEPELIFVKRTIIAIDYVDLLNANANRYYDICGGNEVCYTDVDDTDMLKRLRFGVSTLLYENTLSSFGLALGLYQGTYTAGVTFTAGILNIGFTTYEEQLGPTYGDDSDRRYNINAGVIW